MLYLENFMLKVVKYRRPVEEKGEFTPVPEEIDSFTVDFHPSSSSFTEGQLFILKDKPYTITQIAHEVKLNALITYIYVEDGFAGFKETEKNGTGYHIKIYPDKFCLFEGKTNLGRVKKFENSEHVLDQAIQICEVYGEIYRLTGTLYGVKGVNGIKDTYTIYNLIGD